MRVKIFSLFLSFALLLPHFASAAPDFTCADVRQMKNNHRDSRWKSGDIWQLSSRYAKIFSCIKRDKSLRPNHNFWESIVRYHMSKMEAYFAQNASAAEQFANSVSAIARSYGNPTQTICFNRQGKRIPCKKKSQSQNADGDKLSSALEQQRADQETDAQEREADYYLSLVENLPPGKERDQEERAALLKIYDAVEKRKDISKFIAKLAKNHKDITPSFITSAFMLYAESLPTEGLNAIYKYTGSSYDEVIQFSAARAIALYSADRLNIQTGEKIDNVPAGKFLLGNEHRAHIAEVLGKSACGLDTAKENEKLLYVALVSDLSRVYELGSGEEMFANAANFLRCSGGENGSSYLAGAMVLAITYTSEAGATAVGTAAAPLLVVAAGVGLFIYALNDAYVYPTPMQNLMRNFDSYLSSPEAAAPAVEEFPINDEIVGCTLNASSIAWERDFVKYGAREASAANTATCRQTPQPNDPCGDIRLNDLDGRVSMSRDFVKRFKEYLTHQGIPYSSATVIRDILSYSFRGDYRKILELLNNKCNQYSNSKMPGENGAFVKAFKNEKGGGYMPEVEISVDLKPNNILLKDVFSSDVLNKICGDAAFLNGEKKEIDLGSGRSLRNTTHEKGGPGAKGKKHVHYEEQRNGYRCNHSIEFDDQGGSFLKQMRKFCSQGRRPS